MEQQIIDVTVRIHQEVGPSLLDEEDF